MMTNYINRQKHSLLRSMLVAVMLIGTWGIAQAQLSGTYTVPGSFPSLTAAAAAIASDGVSGAVRIEIADSYTGAGETYPIHFEPYTGSGTVTITRVANASLIRTIQSSSTEATIKVTGAGYYFDGRSVGRGNSRYLFVRNNSSAGAAIAIQGDANDISLLYLQILSADAQVSGAAVLISADGTTDLGNINISNNLITNSVASPQPLNGILIDGATNEVFNIGISNNDISNFADNGIRVESTLGGSSIFILGNHIFSTLESASVNFAAIYVNAPDIEGVSVNDNWIGGRARSTGAANQPMVLAGTGQHYGIRVIAASNNTNLTVTNNRIRNISLTSLAPTPNPGYAFQAISVDAASGNAAGSVSITNNLIGDLTNDGFKINSTMNGVVFGIITSPGTASPITITGNNIGNLHLPGTAVNRTRARVIGILFQGFANNNVISNNTVSNLNIANSRTFYNLGNNAFVNSAAAGILFHPRLNSTGNVVSNNTVFNLTHAVTATYNAGAEPYSAVTGIGIGFSNVFYLSAEAEIFNNRVYNLFTSGNANNVERQILGIEVASGTNLELYNNMISLTNGANTNPVNISGFADVNGETRSASYWNNAVYIGGTTTGFARSAGLTRFVETNITVKNNVFYVNRAGGSPNAIMANLSNVGGGAASGWPAGASDYNLCITNSSIFGGWSFDPILPLTYTNWIAVTGCDRSSWLYNTSEVPLASLFVDAATANLRPNTSNINQWLVNGKGQATSFTSDVDGGTRSSVAGTSCDIGVKEITPAGIYANPPSISVNITGPGVYNFVTGNRTLASVNVTTQGSLTALALQNYSQSVAPWSDVPGYGETMANGYYRLTATASAINYVYNATFSYDPNFLGSISSANNAFVSHGVSACKTWTAYLQSTTNRVSVVNTTNRTITVNAIPRDGNFVFSDQTSNPLVHPFQKAENNITTTSADLVWSGEGFSASISYTIQYRAVGAPTFTTVTAPACNTANCTRNITGLILNTDYEWRIKSNCFSDYGPLQTFTTAASKMDETTVSANGLVVYPNPARDFANILLTNINDGSVSIQVLDVMGREVLNNTVDATNGTLQYSLPLADLTAGLYIVKVSGNGFGHTKNLVVTK